jgi:hypothetical protein
VPCDGLESTTGTGTPPGSQTKPVATVVPVAGLGPRLVTVTVNVRKSLGAGLELSTTMSTPTSVTTVAFSRVPLESLAFTGSSWVPPVLVATLLI